MNNKIKTFALMIDCSRNAVYSVPFIKKLIPLLAKMRYTALMLYTEDTYEVNNEPYFGSLRGRYTKQEIKDIVSYANEYNIEVIPCIQVLAHLNQIFKWPAYFNVHDCNDILLIEEERTYQLLNNIFDTISECFTSRRINLGMDEAMTLGLGNYLLKHGFKNRTELFLKHLNKVNEIAKKHGFEPLIWSDMFFRFASKGEYYDLNAKINKETLKELPSDVIPIYWDYYHQDEEFYEKMIDIHRDINKNTWFASGIWTWSGMIPLNKFALKVIDAGLSACNKKNVTNIIMTAWGDNGGECPLMAALPAIYYARRIADGVNDLSLIKKEFKDIIGYEFDDFMMLDDLNDLTLVSEEKMMRNPSKYFLYNDPLLGVLDKRVNLDDDKHYQNSKELYLELEKRMGEYSYIPRFYAALSDLLSYKASFGVRLRKAYKDKNNKELQHLSKIAKKIIDKIDEIITDFRNAWLSEKKPHGFDVIHIRLGGLKERMTEVIIRLDEYLSRKTDVIEELEEDILPFVPNDESKDADCYNDYILLATPNRL